MQESDFHEVADEFIHLANEMSEEWAPNLLSAAILYAAARYNAFHFMETNGDPADQGKAIDFYSDQYRKMLQENLHELRRGVPHA
jgi:Protein of unknown function (DUF3144)